MKSILILISIFSVLLLSGCSARNAYERGNIAYAQGDYKTAFENYRYAAHHHISAAQYALGYQYFYGIGVKRDNSRGIHWLIKASQYSPQAEHALRLIQEQRPALPWRYLLRTENEKQIKYAKKNSHKACLISVQCER